MFLSAEMAPATTATTSGADIGAPRPYHDVLQELVHDVRTRGALRLPAVVDDAMRNAGGNAALGGASSGTGGGCCGGAGGASIAIHRGHRSVVDPPTSDFMSCSRRLRVSLRAVLPDVMSQNLRRG